MEPIFEMPLSRAKNNKVGFLSYFENSPKINPDAVSCMNNSFVLLIVTG